MIRIGTRLFGYCGGYFGDSYDNKRVEAVGADWVVAREDGGKVRFAQFEPGTLDRVLSPFTKDPEQEVPR